MPAYQRREFYSKIWFDVHEQEVLGEMCHRPGWEDAMKAGREIIGRNGGCFYRLNPADASVKDQQHPS